MKNNTKTSVMAAVMALTMTGCGNLDGSVSSSEKIDSQITETTTVSTAAQWTPDLPSAVTSVTKRTVETTTTTKAKTTAQTSKTTKKTEKKSETTKKTTTSKSAKTVAQTQQAQPVQQQTQTYTYYEYYETPETEYVQPETQPATQAAQKPATQATTTTAAPAPTTKSEKTYSDWDKALAAWAIGDISASQRKMITDKLNQYTAEYAKSYPFKMKQSNDVVPFRKNGTGQVLEKLTWDEQWNNFAEGVNFSDGTNPDLASYYYQGYMNYNETVTEVKAIYDDAVSYKLFDSFEDGRLDMACAGNYDVTIEYNWVFYEDTDVSESYTSQSGHEVHAWYLVFCSKADIS